MKLAREIVEALETLRLNQQEDWRSRRIGWAVVAESIVAAKLAERDTRMYEKIQEAKTFVGAAESSRLNEALTLLEEK